MFNNGCLFGYGRSSGELQGLERKDRLLRQVGQLARQLSALASAMRHRIPTAMGRSHRKARLRRHVSDDAQRHHPHASCRYFLLAILLIAPGYARSQVALPPINLGSSSFVDADGGPGTIVQWTNAAFRATHVVDGAGDRVPGPFRQEVATSLIHIAHTSRHKVAGAYAGIEILLPVTHLSVNTTGLDASQNGIGDVALGAVLQWSDLSLGSRPLTVRADFVVVAPTGQYSRDRQLNAGFNVWQLAPYVAATWHATEKWEVSGRFTYNWSEKNDKPAASLLARSVQSGQQASLNLAASYALAPGWRIGLAGYRHQQLTDSKIDDQSLPGIRQRVWGAGPGLLWSSGNLIVFGNIYKEFSARNRPEGYQAVVRLVRVF